ncbi:MAG TPA: ABC transporter permease [Acidobacteriota bacterium]|nr:ABC transporter permease [Acidobacteriota bacterium]
MTQLFQDLRFALRTLFKNPGFTIVAVLALALGIGANASIFSFVNAFLLRPMPFAEPERLVHVWGTDSRRGYDKFRVSVPEFQDWRERGRSFADLAAFNYTEETLTGLDVPEKISAGRVSSNLMELLGVEPLQGRAFLPGEDSRTATPVAVISERLWKNRLGGEAVLGQPIEINETAYAIIGVMPDRFRFPLPTTDVWMPRIMDREWERDRHFLQVVGRLRQDVSRQQAQEEMDRISADLRQEYPQLQGDRGANVTDLRSALNFAHDIIQPMSGILLAAVGFVLLIACANVANLLLSRSAARRREIALRSALGAARGRLLRQLLTESAVLSLMGAAAGLLLAHFASSAMASLIPADLYKVGAIGLDFSVFLYTLALALLTALIFGTLPALRLARSNLVDNLKEGGAGSGWGRSSGRMHGLLVTAEISMAIILLVGAALMVRSFLNLQDIDPGFEGRPVLTAKLEIPSNRYGEADQRRLFHRRLIEEVGTAPQVSAAATVNLLPLNHETDAREFSIVGRPTADSSPRYATAFTVSPEYFKVLGVPILQGRGLRASDDENAPLAAVISQSMADRHWPRGNALGSQIEVEHLPQPVTVVGIAADTRQTDLAEARQSLLFLGQMQIPSRYFRVLARSQGDPRQLAGTVRAALARIDATIPLTEVRTLQEVVEEFLLPQRTLTQSLGILSSGALLLAAIGIYGLMAFFVSQRVREIGIRMALGARRQDVLTMVLGRVGRLAAIGVVIGLAGAFALTRFMAAFLEGVQPADPVSFLIIALLLGAVAVASGLIPAARASRIDPLTALRHE